MTIMKIIIVYNLSLVFGNIAQSMSETGISGSVDRLFSSLSTDNPVFSGGFGLALLAGGAQLMRGGYQVGFRLIKRHFLVTLEVTSKDRSYPWVLQWLSMRGGARTQHLSVETSFKPVVGNASNMSFDLVPGPGQHFLNYNGRLMLIQRVREQSMVDLNTGKPWEKVLFTSYGRNTSVFDEMLLEAYGLSVQKEEGKTIIYTNWGSEWKQFGQPRRRRTLNSVILDEGVSSHLLADVEEWIGSSKWYSDRGIPYRRGYLLYGPPGSGKVICEMCTQFEVVKIDLFIFCPEFIYLRFGWSIGLQYMHLKFG
jgi:mitochondrial chaperone BCS1